jgi:dTDP-4-amino-4,6-dideoxygalactose transaminase
MKKTIKMVDLKSQYNEIKEELWQEWEKVFDSMYLMLGPNMKAFEKEFAEYSGAKFGIGVDSGTTALFLALKSMDIGEGDAVIVPSFTFFATIEAVIQTGALPIMIDIDEDNFTISLDKIKEYFSKNSKISNGFYIDKQNGRKIKGIIPVHLYGNPADMKQIKELAEEYNLKILEDCAQAHGAEFEGDKVGSIGDMGAFSFYFSKNLSALGEGGIILTDNEKYADIARKLRVHGQSDKYTHEMVGYNSRLDELQAVILRLKLKRLEEWNNNRVKAAEYYNKKLKEFPLILPKKSNKGKHVYHLFVIRTNKRDELFKFLKENGVEVGIHYPIPSHLQPALDYLGYKEGSLPVTEKISKEILTLPMHPHLKTEDIDYIHGVFKRFFD